MFAITMIYLATASGPLVCQTIADGRLGQMVTPNSGNRLVSRARWAIGNGCSPAGLRLSYLGPTPAAQVRYT